MFKVTHIKITYAAWKEGDDEPEKIDTDIEVEDMTFREVQELLDCGYDWEYSNDTSFRCTNSNDLTPNNLQYGETVDYSIHLEPSPTNLKHWAKLEA